MTKYNLNVKSKNSFIKTMSEMNIRDCLVIIKYNNIDKNIGRIKNSIFKFIFNFFFASKLVTKI